MITRPSKKQRCNQWKLHREARRIVIMLSTAATPKYIESNEHQIVEVMDECWQLNIPNELKQHKEELAGLLDKVFNNCPKSQQNVELAKQLALNWCTSKCKELDIPVENCMSQLAL